MSRMPRVALLKQWAHGLKRETFALYLAARHPGTPWLAKLLAAAVVAYALSPIDLIPDFIPILGYLDDLILVPLGLALAVRMIPPEILAECRERAGRVSAHGKPGSRTAVAVIVLIWCLLAGLGMVWGYRAIRSD